MIIPSVLRRVSGSLRLDPATYREIALDQTANRQAVGVVVAVGMAQGAGEAIFQLTQRATLASAVVVFVDFFVATVVLWYALALCIQFMGRTIADGGDFRATR